MSYVYPNYPTTYIAPTGVESSTSGSSCTGWIVAFILFLLVAIGLGIWLMVLYLGGHVGKGDDRIVTLSGASIKATENTITGSWTTLNNDADKVTLYVSENVFVFNDNGQVINNNEIVQQDSQVGPNGKISIAGLKNSTAYNAMMIVTGDDTVHYRIYGPKKVFTQVQSDIQNQRFYIQNLNSCNGAVSDTATYTTAAGSFGEYRLGSNTNTNTDSRSLLLRYDEDQDTETEQVLCRIPTATQLSQVSFGYWVNRTESTKPIICSSPNANNPDSNATSCDTTSTSIALENCQWSYNEEPSVMKGLNQWCLSTTGTTTINSALPEPLCLARNGQALTVVNGQTNTDTWFNQPITLSVLN